ncbi:MAG: insulinase family protein [Candidatus Omnitrophota bacterium]|jgi:predicted Zn-dependent peptidase|nr:MAG: insulinase family protein [Candidatus Omnitrophota bacterium]
MKYDKKTLDNGLRIITCSMEARRSLSLGIWIKTGGRYENNSNKGISHYLEHLIFKGSKKYSCREIKESIEGIGGSLNGFTSEELTCYLVKAPAQYCDLCLNILADMSLNPLLDSQDIEKERTVILEEIKMYRDLPQSYVYELLDALLWPAQPLGMSIAGSEESVKRIKQEDLVEYQRRYYAASGIIVSAAGQLDPDKFASKVETIFSGVGQGQDNEFLPVSIKQAKPQLNLFHKDTEQTHLALAFHALKRDHPMKYALALMHIIMGGNMSSRLFNEIREKRGLAYEIGAAVKKFHDCGSFIIHAGIDNTKVEEALKLILAEAKKIRETLITEDELKRAKEFYAGQLMLSLEDTMDHMLWIGESISTIGRLYSVEEIMNGINNVSREDIRGLAQAIFKEEGLNLALIGPVKNIEEKLYKELFIKS